MAMDRQKAPLRTAAEAAKLAADNSARNQYLDQRLIDAIDKAIHGGQGFAVIQSAWMMNDYHYVKSSLESLGYEVKEVQVGLNETETQVHWPLVRKMTMAEVISSLLKIYNQAIVSETQQNPASLSTVELQAMRGRNSGRQEVAGKILRLVEKIQA